jgi:hypothetical protein
MSPPEAGNIPDTRTLGIALTRLTNEVFFYISFHSENIRKYLIERMIQMQDIKNPL